MMHYKQLYENYFRGCWKKFCLLLIYPIAVILATPSYVCYICFVATRRIVDIEYRPYDPFRNAFKGQFPGILKFSEITLESETQLILGECHENLIKNQNIISQVCTYSSCWAPLKAWWTRSSNIWDWPLLYSVLSRASLNIIFSQCSTSYPR